MMPRPVTLYKYAIILFLAALFSLSFFIGADYAEESDPAGESAPAGDDSGSSDGDGAEPQSAESEEAAPPRPIKVAEEPRRITDLNMKEITAVPEGMEGTISLDLRNIDVVDALKFLSMKASLNVISTKDVTGRITLMVENVRIKDVFDIMLRSNGLAYAKEGGIYNIMTETEYKALYGKKFSDIRQVKTFKLQYAIPEQAFSMLDALKSEIGRVLVEPDSGTAMIMDTPEKIKELERAISTLEEKNLIEPITLKYAKAKDVEEQLKLQLDAKKVGTIKADERSNQVIIQALPGRMPDIERLVRALDQKTKEVLIETKIIKIRLGDTLDAGMKWEGLLQMAKEYGISYIGSVPFAPITQLGTSTIFKNRTTAYNDALGNIGNYNSSGLATPSTAGSQILPGTLHVGIINNRRDLDATLTFLNTLDNSQIIANPKIAVINNQEARVHIGEKQAYVTTTTTTGQSTSTVSEEVTFVDVGIQLSVTPMINEDGYVTMKIKPEISSVTSTLITPSNNEIPIIDTSVTETTVMVKDGSTIIIGGLRRDEKTKKSDGVPYLSKIPILGFFFKKSSDEVQRTELLIMITPTIIEGDTLTTGDERDFKYLPGKGYKKYGKFTDEPDVAPPSRPPEDRIKPYKEYSEHKQETNTEYAPEGIKNEQY
ncbi:MAG: secretin N-terminal domain-containing protein [Candidatus Omnitrophota bacterium]